MQVPPAPDLLDAAVISSCLAAQSPALPVAVRVEVCERCESTNSALLERAAEEAPLLLLAEEQTAGRGRRGRRWHGERGAALTFSLLWNFKRHAGRLHGLSLAIGVGSANALRGLGARDVALKWPNDLVAPVPDRSKDVGANASAKLGGVLIETRSSGARTAAVIGVGLNCRRMPGLDARLGRRSAALEDLIVALPARNAIAARLAAEIVRTLRAFESAGLAAFRAEWISMHAHEGERLRVRTADGRVLAGIAEGIAADGALLLRTRRGVHSILSGSVLQAA